MAGETIGIFVVMLGSMGMAIYLVPRLLVPRLAPRICRKALSQGFAPTVAFMVAGMIGHDTGLVSAYAYTSLWAIGLFAMHIVPLFTVARALLRNRPRDRPTN